jgi:hypothetical protein
MRWARVGLLNAGVIVRPQAFQWSGSDRAGSRSIPAKRITKSFQRTDPFKT